MLSVPTYRCFSCSCMACVEFCTVGKMGWTYCISPSDLRQIRCFRNVSPPTHPPLQLRFKLHRKECECDTVADIPKRSRGEVVHHGSLCDYGYISNCIERSVTVAGISKCRSWGGGCICIMADWVTTVTFQTAQKGV